MSAAARRAARDACRRYGIKVAEADGLAHYPVKEVATDPAMEHQRLVSGLQAAWDAFYNLDRPDGNTSPTPDVGGTINRTEG